MGDRAFSHRPSATPGRPPTAGRRAEAAWLAPRPRRRHAHLADPRASAMRTRRLRRRPLGPATNRGRDGQARRADRAGPAGGPGRPCGRADRSGLPAPAPALADPTYTSQTPRPLRSAHAVCEEGRPYPRTTDAADRGWTGEPARPRQACRAAGGTSRRAGAGLPLPRPRPRPRARTPHRPRPRRVPPTGTARPRGNAAGPSRWGQLAPIWLLPVARKCARAAWVAAFMVPVCGRWASRCR